MAEEWWDPTESLKPYINLTLKGLNLLGINWLNIFQLSRFENPFSNLDILDIGCGGEYFIRTNVKIRRECYRY